MKNTPIYFKGLGALLIMFTIYGIAIIVFNPGIIHYPISGKDIQSYSYIKSIYLSLLPIYAFYYFARKGDLTAERLRAWFIVFFISCIYSYLYYRVKALELSIIAGNNTEEITNNAGYLFLSLFPMVVLFRKKPILQYISLAAIMAFIVLGMKRGAIMICGVVMLYFFRDIIRNAHGKQKFVIIMLTILLCIGTASFVVYWMSESEYMVKRIEETMEGKTSGRDSLYDFFWTYFTEKASLYNYLFGRGANGTLEIYKNYAHNDWLEIAINQGLAGIFIYAYYWICFYKTWRQSTNHDAKLIITLVGIVYFAKTIFSMSYGDMSYVVTSVFGYALATSNQKRKNSAT